MDTDARMHMPIEDQIMTLNQWLSPAYPVGAFAYSHGLEWLVETGVVADGRGLEIWLTDILRYGTGQSDAHFLVAAFRALSAPDVAKIDTMCRAFAPSKGRRMEAQLQGAAFCKVTASVWAQDIADLTYPVAVGRAASLERLPLDLTLRLFLQSFVSNLVGAGMRLNLLGQTEGQQVIKTLMPQVADVSELAIAGSLNDLSGTAFMADIAAMKHETQYSRIFRT